MLFPLPPREAVVIGELVRLPGAREVVRPDAPTVAPPVASAVVPVPAQAGLWEAA